MGEKTSVYDVLSCEEQTSTPLWLASEEVWISMYLLRKWLPTLPLSMYSLYHGSTWLNLTPLHPTMAQLDSTTLYHGSTWLYCILPWLYFTLLSWLFLTDWYDCQLALTSNRTDTAQCVKNSALPFSSCEAVCFMQLVTKTHALHCNVPGYRNSKLRLSTHSIETASKGLKARG